jgi:hypothetical protein
MDNPWRKTKRRHPEASKDFEGEGEIVYQALGWLAREDKINYHTEERKTFVSLSHEEREMFKNSLEVFAKSDS